MVETSRTLLRAQAGVRLERIEQLAKKQRSAMYRLSTHRPLSPKTFSEEKAAQEAFEREVAASLQDPVVVGLMQRGAL